MPDVSNTTLVISLYVYYLILLNTLSKRKKFHLLNINFIDKKIENDHRESTL